LPIIGRLNIDRERRDYLTTTERALVLVDGVLQEGAMIDQMMVWLGSFVLLGVVIAVFTKIKNL